MLTSYRAMCLVDTGPLSQKLIWQLLMSPTCAEILCQGPVPTFEGVSKDVLKKLKKLNFASLKNVDKAFCGKPVDFASVEDSEFLHNANILRVSHLSLIMPRGSHSKAAEIRRSLGGIERLSYFAPQRVTGSCETRVQKLVQAVYPVVSQFLPSRYREISVEHLSLAMRLNAELCIPVKSNPGDTHLEVLMYSDCMQVIGRDDKI